MLACVKALHVALFQLVYERLVSMWPREGLIWMTQTLLLLTKPSGEEHLQCMTYMTS